ncbi:MAG: YciI family protein [Oxalobacteraceae bacterium]|nr:MAG: YciI family protein [Oxalobacteraceae bacterium]
MPFIIETFDRPGHQHLRKIERAAHLAFLESNKILLLACGAKLADDGTDLGGGLYVVALETRDEAQRFIESDPFHVAGLFERVTLTRWRKAYVDSQCFL